MYLLLTGFTMQVQNGEISGKVLDENREGIVNSTITLVEENGTPLGRSVTADYDGNYSLKPLTPGKYNLLFTCKGYVSQMQKGVIVSADKPTWLNANLKPDPNYVAPEKNRGKRKRNNN